MEEPTKEQLSKYFSDLAKKSHKKKPRGKMFYKRMAKKRWAKEKSTDK